MIDVCKITESAGQKGNRRLTTHHFVRELKEIGKCSKEAERLCAELDRYRKLVEEARHKLLAHKHLATVRDGSTLGAHAPEDVVHFFKNLNDFTDEVGRALGVGPCDYSVQPGKGDVIDLIRVLRDYERLKGRCDD